jgi:hypothetical protein
MADRSSDDPKSLGQRRLCGLENPVDDLQVDH